MRRGRELPPYFTCRWLRISVPSNGHSNTYERMQDLLISSTGEQTHNFNSKECNSWARNVVILPMEVNPSNFTSRFFGSNAIRVFHEIVSFVSAPSVNLCGASSTDSVDFAAILNTPFFSFCGQAKISILLALNFAGTINLLVLSSKLISGKSCCDTECKLHVPFPLYLTGHSLSIFVKVQSVPPILKLWGGFNMSSCRFGVSEKILKLN